MDNTQAVINFMYFGHNYPHDFIERVWGASSLASHLGEKFGAMYHNYGTMTFFRWFMELDEGNKAKLTEWIEANYKG